MSIPERGARAGRQDRIKGAHAAQQSAFEADRGVSLRSQGVTAYILAGGRSRRMGANKALVPVGGRPLASWVIGAARQLTPRVVLLGGPPMVAQSLHVPYLADRPGWAGAGPVAALYTALSQGSSRVLLLACDLPGIRPVHLRRLLAFAGAAPAAAPEGDGRLHPVCGVYDRRLIGRVRWALARRPRRPMQAVFAAPGARRLPARLLGPDWRLALTNVNTPADLETFGSARG